MLNAEVGIHSFRSQETAHPRPAAHATRDVYLYAFIIDSVLFEKHPRGPESSLRLAARPKTQYRS
jgi:hypothetical protein